MLTILKNCDFATMEKLNIEYLFLITEANDEIETKLSEIYGDYVYSLSNIKYWTTEFKCGCTSIFVKDHSRPPNEVATSLIIEKNPRYCNKRSENESV